jgi:diguanylate cyclase (GGDEF)-like protein
MNMKDGLTGVFNRRFMEAKLEEECKRSMRYGCHFSVIMFDIDYFKKVNDGYGHQCGDLILKLISSRIAGIVRDVDYLARYGGEEFCCLLPETDINAALQVAERFRVSVMELESDFEGATVKVTISLGVAALNEKVCSPELLLKKADEALYRAKREGRNRVVVMS